MRPGLESTSEGDQRRTQSLNNLPCAGKTENQHFCLFGCIRESTFSWQRLSQDETVMHDVCLICCEKFPDRSGSNTNRWYVENLCYPTPTHSW